MNSGLGCFLHPYLCLAYTRCPRSHSFQRTEDLFGGCRCSRLRGHKSVAKSLPAQAYVLVEKTDRKRMVTDATAKGNMGKGGEDGYRQGPQSAS